MINAGKSLAGSMILVFVLTGCAETRHYLADTRELINENAKVTAGEVLDPSAPNYWTDYMNQQGGG
jgi:hypothetical protein